jgi:hypothetical protein
MLAQDEVLGTLSKNDLRSPGGAARIPSHVQTMPSPIGPVHRDIRLLEAPSSSYQSGVIPRARVPGALLTALS